MIPEHWRRAALSPPTAWGEPLGGATLRATPEDFEVEEILGFAPGGEGPHALLTVRKRGANTEWVAREIARASGCKPFEVGFAGLKDRNAVTTQHFTVPRGKRAAEEFVGLAGEGYEVLAASAHQRKLPRGALEGNRFTIVARGLACDAALLGERIARIAAGGVPNYFGSQRFGRDAGNLAEVLRSATKLARGAGVARGRRGGRDDRGFMLSAARSLVFNAILAERVTRRTWNELLAGDVANLDGRGSVFAVPEVDSELQGRCASLELHPTAPLPGQGEPLATGDIRALENSVGASFPEALAVITAEEMNSERRALRMRVRELSYEYTGDILRLHFALGAGSFATTVLREIIAATDDE
jgi:tRNA pseudouridine13 synthase